MIGKKISEQLSFLPDDIIEEAMEMPKRQRTLRFTARALRAAACLAVIAGLIFGIWGRGAHNDTPGGLLTISVGAVSNDGPILTNVALDKNLELSENFRWSPAYNYLPGIPLTLSVSGNNYDLENVYFDVTINGGSFLKPLERPGQYKQVPLHATLANNSTVYWHCWYDSPNGAIVFEEDCAYVDIIVFEKDTIIGFAVIGFRHHYVDGGIPTLSFGAVLLESVMFSQEEIRQNPVSEDHIRMKIEEVKNQA